MGKHRGDNSGAQTASRRYQLGKINNVNNASRSNKQANLFSFLRAHLPD